MSIKDDLKRIDVFSDSIELANELNRIGIDAGGDGYYMREGAVQITEMWKLLISIRNNCKNVEES